MGREKPRRTRNIVAVTTGTGMYREVPTSKLGATVTAVPSRHDWIVIASFRVSDETIRTMGNDGAFLDTENLVNVAGPMCYVCEEPYTAELAKKPCTGDPSGLM